MITVRDKLLDVLGFLRFVVRRWTEDRCPQIAGSLAFTTLLALVPIFAIAVALLSSMPFFGELMAQVKVFLLINLAPELAGKIITVYMEEFRRNAGRLTTLGVFMLFGTALALMLTVDRSINAIWRTRRTRPYWVTILAYMLLLSTGPVLIGVSVSVTTYLMMSLSTEIVGVSVKARTLVLQVVPGAVSAVAFLLLYRLVPHRRVSWVHALVGGVVAAVLFEVAKQGFGIYMHVAPTYSIVYGTFAAVPFFLLWLYMSWMVVLLGAEVAASLEYWKGGQWRRLDQPMADIGDAVTVARRLFEAKGKALSFKALHRETGMPVDHLEDALHHMAASGLVEDLGVEGYAIPDKAQLPRTVRWKRFRKARRGTARSGRSSR